jgi:DNA-binding response OmpR family regulator
MHILVADDEFLTQQLVEFKLKRHGFDVTIAGDGESAIRLAQEIKPDLIILDWMMPVKDGYEVLRYLKSRPELRLIPVIVLTTRRTEGDIVSTLELGAADYILKPFNPGELVARVKKLLPDKPGPVSPGLGSTAPS